MMTIGEKIGVILTNSGWRQKDLAEAIFVSPSTVSKWLSGTNTPPLDIVKRISALFDVPIANLVEHTCRIPEYEVLEITDDYPGCTRIIARDDTPHTIINASLPGGALLHRFLNPAGDACSAIYVGGYEVWWHYREHEPRMIQEWIKQND